MGKAEEQVGTGEEPGPRLVTWPFPRHLTCAGGDGSWWWHVLDWILILLVVLGTWSPSHPCRQGRTSKDESAKRRTCAVFSELWSVSKIFV